MALKQVSIRTYLEVAIAVIVLITAGLSLNLSSNPEARPNAFTGTQGKELSRRIESLESWRQRHIIWGRERAGKNDVYHEDFKRRLSDVERQTLDLYQNHHETRQ